MVTGMRSPGREWASWARGVGSLTMIVLSLSGMATPPAQPTPPAHQPAPSFTIIDWVPFVQFGDIQYLASSVPGPTLTSSALGPRYAQVRHKVEGNVHDPRYRPQNGDAAFLDVGTLLYLVKGYRATFRLAAHVQDSIVLFEADSNPHARRGVDLLDIAGKVRALEVTSSDDRKGRLAMIRQPQQIAGLVALILRAPVDQQRQMGPQGWTYALTFYLHDGTRVRRVYDAPSGLLERGILLPHEFARLLQGALRSQQ